MGEPKGATIACPECGLALARSGGEFSCAACRGAFVPIEQMRRRTSIPFAEQLARRARAGPAGAICAQCHRVMRAVPLDVNGVSVEVDHCLACRATWLDGGEWLLIASRSEADANRAVQRATKEAARAEGEDFERSHPGPENAAQWAVAVAGFPVEHAPGPRPSFPIATWLLVAGCVLGWLAALPDRSWVADFGFLPADPLRVGGVTLVTSFFLHASLGHLVGNAWFLVMLGDDVEEALGRVFFLVLVFAASFAGDFLHALVDPRSDLPLIGASGGISGVLVFYALAFPQNRIGTFIRWPFWLRLDYVTMRVGTAVLVWILVQALGVFLQSSGHGFVSAAGHVGGALVGLAAWWLFRARLRLELRSS